MGWLSAAAAVVSIASSYKGAKDAKKAANDKEEAIRMATKERTRRIAKTRDALYGQITSRAGASGVDIGSGSLLEVYKDSANELEKDIQITEQAGADKAQLADLAGDTAVWQGVAGAVQGAGQLVGAVQSTDWYQNLDK